MGFIKNLFSPPKPPAPPPLVQQVTAPPPPVPTRAEPEVREARERESKRGALARGRGRRSTILTSPLGATDTPRVSRRAALGDVV